jgi:dihydrodipicolinate reductase
MLIVVFGAGGRVGRLVVNEALNRGHRVIAFTHSSEMSSQDSLIIRRGDIHDAVDVTKAISGADAVVSALGSWGTSSKDILSAGMENIIPAMKAEKIKRIVSLTGLDVEAKGDNFSIVHVFSRGILKLVGGKILSDGNKHIEMLEMSGLDWTVVRSPRMNDGDNRYLLSKKRINPLSVASRQAVAKCLVDLSEETDYLNMAPYIKNA